MRAPMIRKIEIPFGCSQCVSCRWKTRPSLQQVLPIRRESGHHISRPSGREKLSPPNPPPTDMLPEGVAKFQRGIAANQSCEYANCRDAMSAPQRGQQRADSAHAAEEKATAKADTFLLPVRWFHNIFSVLTADSLFCSNVTICDGLQRSAPDCNNRVVREQGIRNRYPRPRKS